MWKSRRGKLMVGIASMQGDDNENSEEENDASDTLGRRASEAAAALLSKRSSGLPETPLQSR